MSETPNLPARADHSEGTSVDKKMAGFSGDRTVFLSSFDTTTPEGKVKLFNALSDATPIADHLDKPIELVDYAVQVVEYANQDGEMEEGIRAILIDKDGKPYAGLSDGLLRSLQMVVTVMGTPDSWEKPVKVKVVEERSRRGFKFYTMKLA